MFLFCILKILKVLCAISSEKEKKMKFMKLGTKPDSSQSKEDNVRSEETDFYLSYNAYIIVFLPDIGFLRLGM